MKYKELIDDLTTLIGSHKMVKEVVYAPNWKVNEQPKPGRKYFLAVISPNTTNYSENVNLRSIRITVMDVMAKDFDNRLQIQSDCEGILVDVISKIKFDQGDMYIVQEPIITIFEEQFADYCAGAIADLVFETDQEGACDLPFE